MENGASSHSWDVCLCGRSTCDSKIVQDIKKKMIIQWNHRNHREIPEEILNHGEHIEEIQLESNGLEKLPSDIGKLKNLTKLYLHGNQLTCLPDQIGDLNSLKVLDVSQNFLKQLPESLGQLKLLERLILSRNGLDDLSLKCLKNLNRLKQLDLSSNEIRSISCSVVDGLVSLEELGLERNPISFLPRNICQLRNLRYLSAFCCNLLYLPSLPFHYCVSARSSKNYTFLFDRNPRLNYIPHWALQQLDSTVLCWGCSLKHAETWPTDTLEFRPSGVPWREHSSVKLALEGSLHTLNFDPDILQFNRKSVKVPSLLEICLRQVFIHDLLNNPVSKSPVNEPPVTTSCISSPPQPLQTFVQLTNPQENLLPFNLQQILDLGPVAKCFQCLAPVFTQSWPVTFQVPENIPGNFGRLNLSCTHFCSGSCIIKFAQGSSSLSNLLLKDLRCIIDREIVWFQ